jgi:hypothetical protein
MGKGQFKNDMQVTAPKFNSRTHALQVHVKNLDFGSPGGSAALAKVDVDLARDTKTHRVCSSSMEKHDDVFVLKGKNTTVKLSGGMMALLGWVSEEQGSNRHHMDTH